MAASHPSQGVADMICDHQGCLGKPAISYCITCGEKLCVTHKRAHDIFHEIGHATLSISDYAKTPERFQKSYCSRHAEFEIIKACRHCDRQICDECDVHDGKCSGKRPAHEYATLKTLEVATTAHYKALNERGKAKVSQLSELDEKAVQAMNAEKKKCADQMQEIETRLDRKIQRTTDEADLAKNSVLACQNNVQARIRLYRDDLAAKKTQVEKACANVNRLVKRGHLSELIRKKQEAAREVDSKVNAMVTPLQLTDQRNFLLRGIRRLDRRIISPQLLVMSLLVLLLTPLVTSVISMSLFTPDEPEVTRPPKSLVYQREARRHYYRVYSAFFKADGNILVGTSDGVKLVNRSDMAVTSYDTPFKIVLSIAVHHNVTYLLHKKDHVGRVVMRVTDQEEWQMLLEFYIHTDFLPTMTVSTKHIVVDKSLNELLVYDLTTGWLKTVQSPMQIHPYFLPNGHLLTNNRSALSKYRLEDGELTELWICGGIKDIDSIVADDEGYIYALSPREENEVSVISPDGELLATIHNDELLSYVGQASISGDEIVVPGWDDWYLQLYKIKRE